MKLDIYSPQEVVFSGEVDAVFFPGSAGAFEVLKNHAPIVSTLSCGDIRYRVDGKEESIHVTGGVVRNENNSMVVCIEK